MKSDLAGLTNAERWRYHAYDYAFLRSRGDTQDAGYALDPHGKWFNEGLVQAAERIYARPRPPPIRTIPRAEVEPDHVLAAHFQRQDDERIPLKRQVQIHGEHRADGSFTPEMEAFMICCVRQATDNGKQFVGRTRTPYAPEARMSQSEISNVHEALGVTVTERNPPKHEDPEELRKAAKELGIVAPSIAGGTP